MYKVDAIKHFGKQTDVAIKLDISAAAVSAWGAIIPEKQALRLARLTKGQLPYQEELYQTNPAAQLGS